MGRLCPQIWSTPFGPEVSSELVLLLFIVVSTETKAAWSFLLFHIVLNYWFILVFVACKINIQKMTGDFFDNEYFLIDK